MSDFQDEEPVVDPLYIGLTRPPMIKGVTDTAAMAIMVVGVVGYLSQYNAVHGFLLGGALGGITYIACYILCLKDPRIFEIIRRKFQFFARASRRKDYWGGPSIDPF